MGMVVDLVATAAAGLAILDYFGIKPKEPGWGFKMTIQRKWKLAFMLLLVAFSLGLSGYSAYRASRPKLVEKEIPVDRIVEKIVAVPCPEIPKQTIKTKTATPVKESKSQIEIPPGTTIIATTNAPDTAAVGINTGTVTVNPPINPNNEIETYDFYGVKTVGVGLSAKQYKYTDQDERGAFDKLTELSGSKQWAETAKAAEIEIKKAPKWATSYMFAGIAYNQINEKKKGCEYLLKMIAIAGNNSQWDNAREETKNLNCIETRPSLP